MYVLQPMMLSFLYKLVQASEIQIPGVNVMITTIVMIIMITIFCQLSIFGIFLVEVQCYDILFFVNSLNLIQNCLFFKS
jgi:hypothetical protein